MIWFMFGGQPYRLTRAQLAEILGVDLVDVSLHAAVYGDVDPPRRALVGEIAPTHEEISVLFRQPFRRSTSVHQIFLQMRHMPFTWR
jgi:hypothetical protein